MVLLPEDANMTLAELRQMAARQQHQIEAQQQLLIAKEQRLKFLKQQEVRHHALAEQHLDVDCLQNLRERVETQELKLRQLRALRGQVEQQKINNGNLGAELDSVRALFGEKEKELNLAINKVEELTRQLDEIKNNSNRKKYFISSTVELENLKRELIYQTKLTEQQNNYIGQQRESIILRQQDILMLDKKINELTQRLQRKRFLNEQLSSQICNISLSQSPTDSVANSECFDKAISVEPLKRDSQDLDHTQDDMVAKLHLSNKDDFGEFCMTKNDPKYQTLPYNTKFTLKEKQCESSSTSSAEEELPQCIPEYEPSKKGALEMHAVKPTYNMFNFSPRPFTVAYSYVVPKITSHESQSLEGSPTLLSVANAETEPQHTEENKEQLHPEDHKPDDVKDDVNISIPEAETNKAVANGKSCDPIRPTEKNSIKPIVPPKPSVPVKPIISHRPVPIIPIVEKRSDDKDVVNAAISVLQSKSSDKNTFSNYRERLLYYRCIPRYVHRNSHDSFNSGNQSSTYLAKASVNSQAAWQLHNSNDNKQQNEIVKRKALEFPIKPKPLTIRKSPGLEPPKLKVQQVSMSTINRKIPDSSIHISHFRSSLNSQVLAKPSEKDLDQFSVSTSNIKESSSVEDINFKTLSEEKLNNCKNIFNKILPETEGDSLTEKVTIKEEIDVCNNETREEDHCPLINEPPKNVSDNEDSDACDGTLQCKVRKGNLKSESSSRIVRRVSFDPLALLLDAALEGELDLVKKTASQVPNPSAANDEGITALHNAICAGHFDVVKFLVEFGCDINAQDSDGWTPLHCAASCNNLPMVKFLIEKGACIFATTFSDHETAAEKCEEDEEGFDGCSEYLYGLQENLGDMNGGIVFSVYDYEIQNVDELGFKNGDMIVVLRKGDDDEDEWWWCSLCHQEGYVPRNLLGLYPRVMARQE